MQTQQVLIAFGSNLPFAVAEHLELSPDEIIKRAYKLIGSHPRIQALQLSSIIKSAAVLPADFDPANEVSNTFSNAVARIVTSLSARHLLGVLQGIELGFGREHGKRWRARSLDLDIILFGNQKLSEIDLQIPHPEFQNRMFVLSPLRELLGDDFQIQLGDTSQSLQAIIAHLSRSLY